MVKTKEPKKKMAKSVKSKATLKLAPPKIPQGIEFSPLAIDTATSAVINDNKINDIVGLLNLWQQNIASIDEDTEPVFRHLALGLYNVFIHFIDDNRLVVTKRDQNDEAKVKVVKWLNSQYSKFQSHLCKAIASPKAESLAADAIDLMMQFVKHETDAAGKLVYFADKCLRQMRPALLQLSPGVMAHFTTAYLVPYFDVRFYFFYQLAEVITTTMFDNYFVMAERLKLLSDGQLAETKLPAKVRPSQFAIHFQEVTLKLLGLPDLEISHYQRIMALLHKRIIPHMYQPQQLLDFLTQCYDQGGELSLLTLLSLWELMKKFNLEYPDFYTKLYSLLTPEMMSLAYQSRFLRLCELFLALTHLSSQLVALFIKRLAALTLNAPAPSTVVVIPYVYNLLKLHPTCMQMIHRPEGEGDTFDSSEPNPLKTKALESLVWELAALQNHYHPNIATLAKIYGDPFRKDKYNLEDFYNWLYEQLVELEQLKRYKGSAALEFEEFPLVLGDQGYLVGWSV